MNKLRLSTLVSAIAFAAVILHAESWGAQNQASELTPGMKGQVLNLAQDNPAGLRALAASNPTLATAIAAFATQSAPNSAVAIAKSVSAGAPAALAADIAAAVALGSPGSAADIAAAVAGAHPTQAAGIAAAVTLSVPESAVAIAQSVVQTVPGQALVIAGAMARVATREQRLLIAMAIAKAAPNIPPARIVAAIAREDCDITASLRRGPLADFSDCASLASALGVTLTAVQDASVLPQVQSARTEGAAQAQAAAAQIGVQIFLAARAPGPPFGLPPGPPFGLPPGPPFGLPPGPPHGGCGGSPC